MFREILEGFRRARVNILPYHGDPVDIGMGVVMDSFNSRRGQLRADPIQRLTFPIHDSIFLTYLVREEAADEHLTYRAAGMESLARNMVRIANAYYWCRYAPRDHLLHNVARLDRDAESGTHTLILTHRVPVGCVLKINDYLYGVVEVEDDEITIHRPLMREARVSTQVTGSGLAYGPIPYDDKVYAIMPPRTVRFTPDTGALLRRHTAEGLHIVEARSYDGACRATRVMLEGVVSFCVV